MRQIILAILVLLVSVNAYAVTCTGTNPEICVSKICGVGDNCTDEDFNTLSTWVTTRLAVEDDFVTATKIEKAEVYDDDGYIVDRVDIIGATTNENYYWIVTAPAGERHDGTAPDGTDGDGAVIDCGTTRETCVDLSDQYTKWEWVSVERKSESGCCRDAVALSGSYTAYHHTITFSEVNPGIFTFGIGVRASPAYVYRNIIHGFYSGESNCITGAGGDNSTIAYNNTCFGTDIGYAAAHLDGVWQNNISADCLQKDFAQMYTSHQKYNWTRDATADNSSGPSGDSVEFNISTDTSGWDDVVFLSPSTSVFLLGDNTASDLSPYNSGDAISPIANAPDLDVGIRGNTVFDGFWDIGADEYGASEVFISQLTIGGSLAIDTHLTIGSE